jgi:hypothetical protein
VTGTAGTCFAVQADDVLIRGLVVNGCTTSVDLISGSNGRVEGNFLGTEATGAQRLVDSGQEVIAEFGASGAVVGGASPAARNL